LNFAVVSGSGELRTTSGGGWRDTFCGVSTSFASAATATDIATITGSASKTIRVSKVRITATQTTAGSVDIFLVKRSTANSAGTSAAITAVPLDSTSAAATATLLEYTANPTTGTLVGKVEGAKFVIPTALVAGSTYVFDFGNRATRHVVLRGTSQVLAVNLNGVTVTGGAFIVSFEWTEEN
jgi:hypothetical protein